MIKTSIRFFDNVPVRSVWDEETSRWWLCAVDIIEALFLSSSPRKYWNTLKKRKGTLRIVDIRLRLPRAPSFIRKHQQRLSIPINVSVRKNFIKTIFFCIHIFV